jgi:hypothetical protein
VFLWGRSRRAMRHVHLYPSGDYTDFRIEFKEIFGHPSGQGVLPGLMVDQGGACPLKRFECKRCRALA